MRQTAELAFATSQEGTRVIRVPNPMPLFNEEALDTVVSRFKSANPFNDDVGELIALTRAERVTVIETVLI